LLILRHLFTTSIPSHHGSRCIGFGTNCDRHHRAARWPVQTVADTTIESCRRPIVIGESLFELLIGRWKASSLFDHAAWRDCMRPHMARLARGGAFRRSSPFLNPQPALSLGVGNRAHAAVARAAQRLRALMPYTFPPRTARALQTFSGTKPTTFGVNVRRESA